MGGATREFYLEVVREALAIIEDAAGDHLVVGGVATRALFDMPLSAEEDLDVLIHLDDAEKLLDVFAKKGYATHRRDEDWIYKVARPDVTVDLIFRSGGNIRLDEEHLARSTKASLDGIGLRVPAPEDLAVMKAIFDADDRGGRWYDCILILRRFPIDWDYLVARGTAHAPRRILSLLLYALDVGIEVPDRAISRLAGALSLETPEREPT